MTFDETDKKTACIIRRTPRPRRKLTTPKKSETQQIVFSYTDRKGNRRESWDINLKNQGVMYQYRSAVGCSCSSVWYAGRFWIDGNASTAAKFEELLKTG